ncbi:MAG: glycosyltransferase [Candidatus Hydrogenedentota bacterium]
MSFRNYMPMGRILAAEPLQELESRDRPAPSESGSRGAGVRLLVFSDAFKHRNGVGAYYCDLLGHIRERVGAAELVCPGLTEGGKRQGLSIPLPGDPTQKLCLPGILKAIRTMRNVRPNVVVLATPGPYGILGLILAKAFRARCCVGYHTQFDKLAGVYWANIFGKVAAWYLRMLDRLFFRLAHMVVTNSGPVRDSAVELGARNVRLVGTPLEPRLLQAPAPYPRGPLASVLFVGRLAPEKNLEAVIEAAQDMPETRFVIAGDGPLRGTVQEAAAALPNLDYRGWLDRATLLDTLDECEILVVPSRVESFGTVAIEAMCRQRMVLVSPNCGIRDWPRLADGVEVMGDGESLSAALTRLSQWTWAERAQKAKLARQRAERFHASTIDQWLDIFEEVRRASGVPLRSQPRNEAAE